MSAQTTSQSENPKVIEMRERIGIDYIVQRYSIKKTDAKVMGWGISQDAPKAGTELPARIDSSMLASICKELGVWRKNKIKHSERLFNQKT